MTDDTPTKEIIQLHSAGALPGIPGEFGAGRYEIDYVARTATPVDADGQPIVAQAEPESEAGQDQEATQPLQTQDEPVQQPEEAQATPAEPEVTPEAQPEQATTEETQA